MELGGVISRTYGFGAGREGDGGAKIGLNLGDEGFGGVREAAAASGEVWGAGNLGAARGREARIGRRGDRARARARLTVRISP